MIIFNEKQYVEDNILRPYGKIKDISELKMFIRYYNDIGTSYEEIFNLAKQKVDSMSGVCLIAENEYMFKNAYDKAITRKQYTSEPTIITKSEFDWIRSVDNVEQEKILLTLLVIQRFLGSGFVKIDYKDIRDHALSKKQAAGLREIIDELQERGYVKRITDKTYKVLIPQFNDTEPYLVIEEYNRIPASYLHRLKTHDYFYCEWCGRKTKYTETDKNGHFSRIYCKKCAEETNKMRKRTSKK